MARKKTQVPKGKSKVAQQATSSAPKNVNKNIIAIQEVSTQEGKFAHNLNNLQQSITEKKKLHLDEISGQKINFDANSNTINNCLKELGSSQDKTVLNNLLIIATTQAKNIPISLLKNNLVDKNFVDKNEYSALHYAAMQGDVKKIEALIANGADINIQNKEGNTPLHAAVILKKGTEAIKLLLDNGADINHQDKYGNTAAHFAAAIGDQASIELLQEKNADFTIKDKEGLTSLDRAIKHTQEAIDNIDFPAQEQETVVTEDSEYDLTPAITRQKKHWQQKIPSLLAVIKQLDLQEKTGAKFDAGQIDKVSEAINQWNCDKPNALEGSKILELWNNLIGEGAQGEDSNNLETTLYQSLGDITQVEEYS